MTMEGLISCAYLGICGLVDLVYSRSDAMEQKNWRDMRIDEYGIYDAVFLPHELPLSHVWSHAYHHDVSTPRDP